MTTQALATRELPAEWAWLTTICDTSRESCAQPWTFRLNDREVTAVTNGAMAVAIYGAYGAKPLEATENALRKALTPATEGWRGEIDWPALRDFIGPMPDPMTCEVCKGTGYTSKCDECEGSGESECECFDCGNEHYKKCSACDGKGDTPCPDCEKRDRIDPVRVGPAPFNRNLLRQVVQRLPASRVSFAQAEREKPAHFTTDDWMLVVMPIRDDDSRKAAPHFEIAA